MLRSVLMVTVAAALVGCVDFDEPPRHGYGNPPGWIDRNRDGVDDRVQGPRPDNPPGRIDRDRDGVDDRVERRRHGGYYDRFGEWHWY